MSVVTITTDCTWSHRRSQGGGKEALAPHHIFGTYRYFVLWEAFFQTK